MRQIRNNKIEQDDDYDDYEGGKLLKQVVFPDENGNVRKLVKRKRLILTYDPIGRSEFNGMPLKEPIRVSYKTKYPVDLRSVLFLIRVLKKQKY